MLFNLFDTILIFPLNNGIWYRIEYLYLFLLCCAIKSLFKGQLSLNL